MCIRDRVYLLSNKKEKSIVEMLYELESIEYVNIVTQNDEISGSKYEQQENLCRSCIAFPFGGAHVFQTYRSGKEKEPAAFNL